MSVKVQLLQYSQSSVTGGKIATFICDYPRFIHAEVMTHRVFSRNAGSSRAVPVMSMVELANEKMCFPAEFRYNQSGMQPSEPMSEEDAALARKIWEETAQNCISGASQLASLKLHKQWANRMLEWFTPIRVLITATEWTNFLWLRDDKDAQIEIQQVARQILTLLNDVKPTVIGPTEYHLPFITRERMPNGILRYTVEGRTVNLQEAIAISQSCSAQISYRKSDTSYEKAKELRVMFLEAERVHASPFEHQARPMGLSETGFDMNGPWPLGVTHVDRNKARWSGNLKGFIQYRQLVKGNVYLGEEA